MENLLLPEWSDIAPSDFVALLGPAFGMSQLVGENTVAYPSAGKARIFVEYDKGRIVAINPGHRFDPGEWATIGGRVAQELLTATPAITRFIAFSGYAVNGWWRSEAMGVQLLPPPPEAPKPPYELASHPFVLELPTSKSATWLITNVRRSRQYRRLSALFNLLLEGGVEALSSAGRHFWAYANRAGETEWLQEGYFCPGFNAEADSLTNSAADPMQVVPTADYYARDAHELEHALQVPDSLDASLAAYLNLSAPQRASFDRACYWWEMKDRFWTLSQSASYGALVTGVEALIVAPTGIGSCSECGRCSRPGLRDFFAIS